MLPVPVIGNTYDQAQAFDADVLLRDAKNAGVHIFLAISLPKYGNMMADLMSMVG